MRHVLNILKKGVISFAKIPFEIFLILFFASGLILIAGGVGFDQKIAFEKLSTASSNIPLKKAFADRKVELPPQFKSVTCAFKYLVCRVRDTSDVTRDFDTRYFSSQDGSAFLQNISAYNADFSFELSLPSGEIRSTIQYPEKLSVNEAAESIEQVIHLLVLKRDEEISVKEKEKQNLQSWELNLPTTEK